MYSGHETLAKAVVDSLITLLEDLEGDSDRLQPYVNQWWNKALKAIFVFKDKNFREEQEYRLISISSGPPKELKFRTNSGGLVPYIPFHLDVAPARVNTAGKSNYGIERIIVGPALKLNQIHATKAFLGANYIVVSVEKSEIPYVAE